MQINNFFTKRKQEEIELVASPENSTFNGEGVVAVHRDPLSGSVCGPPQGHPVLQPHQGVVVGGVAGKGCRTLGRERLVDRAHLDDWGRGVGLSGNPDLGSGKVGSGAAHGSAAVPAGVASCFNGP